MNGDIPDVYVGVLLPLAVEKPFTYAVPAAWRDRVAFGLRVEVQFGRSRHYAGLVVETGLARPEVRQIKSVLGVLDQRPLVTTWQYDLWKWMARYYACSLGEVMAAALPGHLKLSSETRILAGERLEEALPGLSDDAYLVAEALQIRGELGIDDVRMILQRKQVYPLLQELVQEGVVSFREELQERFRPKTVTAVKAGPALEDREKGLQDLLADLSRSPRQTAAVLSFLQLEKELPWVRKSDLVERAGLGDASFKALMDKGVFDTYAREVSRLTGPPEEDASTWTLSPHQKEKLQHLRLQMTQKPVQLLQGVTGSGKTLLYTDLIRQTLEQGRQVLYLLPEIALTAQLLIRLEQLTGRKVLPYHSRLNQHERVEIWESVLTRSDALVVAPRSGLFLPWFRLGLIIVDEEHDPSYKQQDPAPRYQGRDTAIMLGRLFDAPVILGSATPSLETWHHAREGKYGYVILEERYGGAVLPEIHLVNLRQEVIRGEQGLFSGTLMRAIRETLESKEQVILFQNRRGYAPSLRCETCGWVQECVHCDVALTYHRQGSRMQCHYCGYQSGIPVECPQCGQRKLTLKGVGTQRVEDDLGLLFPEAKVDRLDLDTARSRSGLLRLLDDFSEGRIDILVGTQMLAKGLDFDQIGLVGILQADALLSYPDFRAAERAFQLMVQVAGRAGRKKGSSRVLIQTWEPGHPVIRDVVKGDLAGFYERELGERKTLGYPPFCRLARLMIKHKSEEKAEWAARHLADLCIKWLGADKVAGPASPPVARVAGFHLRTVQVKLTPGSRRTDPWKEAIAQGSALLRQRTGMSGLVVQMDVDPV